MESKRLANYSIYADSIVKVTKCNSITDILYITNKNNDVRTRKINKDEYVILETGEIFKL